jgi:hypothetical protein
MISRPQHHGCRLVLVVVLRTFIVDHAHSMPYHCCIRGLLLFSTLSEIIVSARGCILFRCSSFLFEPCLEGTARLGTLLFFSLFDSFFNRIDGYFCVAQRAFVGMVGGGFCAEPSIDTFRVEYVSADGDLSDGDTLLEFFEAYHALHLHELINSLVIGLLLNHGYQLIYSLLIQRLELLLVHGAYHIIPDMLPKPMLCLDHLLIQLSLSDA